MVEYSGEFIKRGEMEINLALEDLKTRGIKMQIVGELVKQSSLALSYVMGENKVFSR